MRVSYAQHGEDIVLWRAFRDQERGTYVDVGAFHPTDDSVTRLFYERGWRGVNIDPSETAIELFRTERPEDTNLCLAVGDEDGELEFFECDNAGWSTTNKDVAKGLVDDGRIVSTRTVPVRRLSSLLDELALGTVDFLKIDAEGSEAAVLAGIDFSRHRARVVVIEALAPVIAAEGSDVAAPILVGHGYTHAGFDGLNHYFTTDAELVDALRAPANPTDGFIDYPRLRMHEYIASLESQVEDLTTRNAWLADTVKQLKSAESQP